MVFYFNPSGYSCFDSHIWFEFDDLLVFHKDSFFSKSRNNSLIVISFRLRNTQYLPTCFDTSMIYKFVSAKMLLHWLWFHWWGCYCYFIAILLYSLFRTHTVYAPSTTNNVCLDMGARGRMKGERKLYKFIKKPFLKTTYPFLVDLEWNQMTVVVDDVTWSDTSWELT